MVVVVVTVVVTVVVVAVVDVVRLYVLGYMCRLRKVQGLACVRLDVVLVVDAALVYVFEACHDETSIGPLVFLSLVA